MIDVMTNQSLTEVIKTVDMNQTLLLMGRGATNQAVNKIVYYTTIEAVTAAYGESELTEAFKIAKSFGVPHIFLINVKNTYDYIEIANVLRHYDFAYVAPASLYLGDAFFDATRNNKKVGYYHHFLEKLSSYNRSTFVVTDNHASLYEDMDAYLEEMKTIVTQFKNGMTANMNGKNLCFVSNNLENYQFANVVLASILCVTDLGLYPVTGNLGPVIFDIDAVDIGEHEMVYFKDNYLSGVTVENLLNFNSKVEPEKIVMIDRIAKYVRRNLDLSRFKGRNMTAYQKLRIEKALIDYFDPMVNWILRSYQIKNIRFVKDVPGAGVVLCDIDIWPVNSTERFSVVVEG
ncbi:hypothetical protein [Heyndrickxia sporothermodurans]|uniref:hypothetical protein n=1 Tax=Heyndrickxia sporothermodurans TaxID=46224 RepID=UPI000D3A4D87|nr:hypothetical protein [Heyndrickxia sporothermodurans]PTY92888.1 hypothetical protein B5V90_02080 [Heyndrickxia sporothermodurans]